MNKHSSVQKVVILDGRRHCDQHLDAVFIQLTTVLQERNSNVKIFRLRDINIKPCIGCFNCWLKTPGTCIHTDDPAAEILQNTLKSHTVILFTPIVFGGYSSDLKKILDRFLPSILPFKGEFHGEIHQQLRYSSFPRIIGIGVSPSPCKELSECFTTLVGRNTLSLSLRSSHYRAEVIDSIKDAQKTLKSRFHALLSQTDLPQPKTTLPSLNLKPSSVPNIPKTNQNALLIIGSQKTHSSTSAVLGNYLLKELKKHNINIDSLTLKKELIHSEEQQDHLCRAVENADILLLACPLYVDSLPFLVTKGMEVVASHRKNNRNNTQKNFLAIINSGLPESYHSNAALAICKNFALKTDMAWAGGLSFGAGEALISGKPLMGFKGFRGFVKRPPLFYVTRSLKAVAQALAAGTSVPEDTIRLLTRKPIPFISSKAWHYIFIKEAHRVLTKEAKTNGITKEAMYDAPYNKPNE
jgi:multimeric flavodoxin WrbA